MAITPGGRVGDASPLAKPGNEGPRRLDDYVRMVAHAFMRKGMAKGHAIAAARQTLAKWAAGGGNVSPKVQAAAAKALAHQKILDHQGRNTDMASSDESYGSALNPGVDIRDLDLSAVATDDASLDLAPGDYRAPYDWKHGFVPLTPRAAAVKAKKGPNAGKGRAKPPKGRSMPGKTSRATTASTSKPKPAKGVDALANPSEAQQRMARSLTDAELRKEVARKTSKPATRATAQAELDRRAKIRDDQARGRGVAGESAAPVRDELAARRTKRTTQPSGQTGRGLSSGVAGDKPRTVIGDSLTAGDVIEERSPITGKTKRLRVDKTHSVKSDGTMNVNVTDLDSGEAKELSVDTNRSYPVAAQRQEPGGSAPSAIKPVTAGELGGDTRSEHQKSADDARDKRTDLTKRAVAAGYDRKRAPYDSSDQLEAFLDAKAKGHPHPVGAPVNARQPGIERVTTGRVVGYTDNGMVKIQPHFPKDAPVGTFNPSHVAPAGQEPRNTPDSREGKNTDRRPTDALGRTDSKLPNRSDESATDRRAQERAVERKDYANAEGPVLAAEVARRDIMSESRALGKSDAQLRTALKAHDRASSSVTNRDGSPEERARHAQAQAVTAAEGEAGSEARRAAFRQRLKDRAATSKGHAETAGVRARADGSFAPTADELRKMSEADLIKATRDQDPAVSRAAELEYARRGDQRDPEGGFMRANQSRAEADGEGVIPGDKVEMANGKRGTVRKINGDTATVLYGTPRGAAEREVPVSSLTRTGGRDEKVTTLKPRPGQSGQLATDPYSGKTTDQLKRAIGQHKARGNTAEAAKMQAEVDRRRAAGKVPGNTPESQASRAAAAQTLAAAKADKARLDAGGKARADAVAEGRTQPSGTDIARGAITPATAKRMSDDQLETAVRRLMESGTYSGPALDVLEKEMDRRDKARAEGNARGR